MIRKGLQWSNDNIYKPFIKPFAKPILGALGPVGQIIGKGKTIYGSLQNDSTTESFIFNTIKQKSEKNNRQYIHFLYENIQKFDTEACGTYINMREIEELIGNRTAVPYIIPIRFRFSIPLDDLLIFSAFTDYLYGLFGYLKIIFKGCTTDLITGLHAEPLIESGLKNLVHNIKPVTMSIKNYIITEVIANMAGYKATDACLNRVRQFYSQHPFVVSAQCVEVLPFPTSATLTGIRTSQNIPLSHVTDFCLLFPKDARQTMCFENLCYQNMQLSTCGRNFQDMTMNTLDQQFFQIQLNASNLDLIFEATDEFKDALTAPRNTATRRLNPHTDLTSFLITLQCERNSNGTLTFD
ncbi:MAG: hypothetical protein EZS28_002325 [Streblomastix strix]|uniref:Uncharacterized protein n=1 Tax=Streblomastix strix TaxID=222440 RepID=A0A5J4X4I9_9EUKA|nr:MAG: hypothetical protein EZS28_002325 [Streblomastix strix]